MISYEEYLKRVLKKDDRIFAKYLVRPISTRLSWFILKLNIKVTPNQITLLDFCLGIIGVLLLFVAKNPSYVFIASLILYLWSILDSVDGEIARFKNMKTSSGFFLEITFDYFVVALIPLGIGFYIFNNFLSINAIFIGFIDCIFLLSFAFIHSNYNWTYLRFGTQLQESTCKLTEENLFGESIGKISFAKKLVFKLGKFTIKIGFFLIYSGHLILVLSLLSFSSLFLDEVIFLNQFTVFYFFLYILLILLPVTTSMIAYYYMRLKTIIDLKRISN